MVKIRKLEDMRLSPGHCFNFFLQSPEIYQSLKKGDIVEVPEDVASQMQGVEVVDNIGEQDG